MPEGLFGNIRSDMWPDADQYNITNSKLKFDFNNFNYDELITERNSLYKKIIEYEQYKKDGKIDDYLGLYDYSIDEDTAEVNYLYNLYAFSSISKRIADEFKNKLKDSGDSLYTFEE